MDDLTKHEIANLVHPWDLDMSTLQHILTSLPRCHQDTHNLRTYVSHFIFSHPTQEELPPPLTCPRTLDGKLPGHRGTVQRFDKRLEVSAQ